MSHFANFVIVSVNTYCKYFKLLYYYLDLRCHHHDFIKRIHRFLKDPLMPWWCFVKKNLFKTFYGLGSGL
jgi:hypothetical protein